MDDPLSPKLDWMPAALFKLQLIYYTRYIYMKTVLKRYLHTEQQSCCLSTGLPVLFPNKFM